MPLPPIYKYLGVQGAKLTLGNRTFKHAKPSDFNDTEDLTIQSIFPEDLEIALKKLTVAFPDVIIQHMNDPPTCHSPMKEAVAEIQLLLRTKPGAAELVKFEWAKAEGKPIFDLDHMRTRATAFVQEINEFMQGYRVLCVTTLIDSERMWVDYAENHKGIALRIEPNVAKDSKFQLFRPVIYLEKRPPLYDNTLDFIAGSLFGDQRVRLTKMLEKIVYAKTLTWKHESEYRLAIPVGADEEPWNTLRYHPEEITALYLGLAIESVDRDEIQSAARAINPKIAVFQTIRRKDETLSFEKV